MAKKKWFKWVVEFQVYETWVADGFDIDNDRADEILAKSLPYSHSGERKAKVISAPLKKEVRKAQGYES